MHRTSESVLSRIFRGNTKLAMLSSYGFVLQVDVPASPLRTALTYVQYNGRIPRLVGRLKNATDIITTTAFARSSAEIEESI